MRKLIRTVAFTVSVLAASTGALALAAQAPTPGDQSPPPASLQLTAASNYTYAEAQSFDQWSLYDATTSFQGTDITGMLRRNDPATYDNESLLDSTGANYVSFLYGDCVAGTDQTGCPLPLEIQVWPACSRNLEGQTVAGVDVSAVPDETLLIRGVLAYFYEEWTRLEFTAGNAIVVLFGDGRDQLLTAANSLQGVNNGLTSRDNFPIPLECQ